MGAGIAASPHCAETWVRRCSFRPGSCEPLSSRSWLTSSGFRVPVDGCSPFGRALPRFAAFGPKTFRLSPALPLPSGLARKPCLPAPAACPMLACSRLRRTSSPLPSSRPWHPRSCDHFKSTFACSCGPSWDDHSWLPSKAAPKSDPPFGCLEDDHLFRRLLPAVLWKSSNCTREPGDPAACSIPFQRLPAEIGFFGPCQSFLSVLPAEAAAPDHPWNMTPKVSRAKRIRQRHPCG